MLVWFEAHRVVDDKTTCVSSSSWKLHRVWFDFWVDFIDHPSNPTFNTPRIDVGREDGWYWQYCTLFAEGIQLLAGNIIATCVFCCARRDKMTAEASTTLRSHYTAILSGTRADIGWLCNQTDSERNKEKERGSFWILLKHFMYYVLENNTLTLYWVSR